jgi:predicted GNAT family acetyltransferase
MPAELADAQGMECRREGKLLRLTARAMDHPMVNRVMGVGLDRSAEQELDALAEHYADAGIRRWMMQVLPHVETETFRKACEERGFVKLRGWAKHVGPSTLEITANTDLRVERVGEDRAQSWAAVVGETFGVHPELIPWLARLGGREKWRLYGAFDGNELVAAAALYVHDETFGALNWAGTKESHRGRGAQSALIARRFEDARELGLKWLCTETDEELPDKPNPSYHNMVRLGLPVKYVRANWGPPKPEA